MTTTNESRINSGTVVDFIVIGAMKAGTTSIYRYLESHPEIDMIHVKELNFFNNGDNWGRGIAWYNTHFSGDGRLKGDVNPNYSMYPRCTTVPENLFQTNPDVRLVYLIRDPVQRTISHIHHNQVAGKEDRGMDEIFRDLEIGKDPFNYVAYSMYHQQLMRFARFFNRDKFYLIVTERLKKDRTSVLAELFSFLKIDSHHEADVFQTTYHKTAEKRKLNTPARFSLGNPITAPLAQSLIRSRSRAIRTLVSVVKGRVSRPVPRPELREHHRAYLRAAFAEDVAQLRVFADLDLREWQL